MKEEGRTTMTANRSALDQLAPLLGVWDMTSRRYSEGRGRMVMARMEDGAFAQMRASEEQGRFPTSTWIIGADDAEGPLYAVTHDNCGVSRVYRMSVEDGKWSIWRNAPGFSQRFTGTVNGEGDEITGEWEISRDGSTWEADFDLTYRKGG